MAGLTKGLPVLLIPEQTPVTAMRNDVVDYSCGPYFSMLHALRAQRIPFQEVRAGAAPLLVIAAGIRSASDTVGAVLDMFLTVHAAVAEIGTAGKAARAFRFCWHHITSESFLPCGNKKDSRSCLCSRGGVYSKMHLQKSHNSCKSSVAVFHN